MEDHFFFIGILVAVMRFRAPEELAAWSAAIGGVFVISIVTVILGTIRAPIWLGEKTTTTILSAIVPIPTKEPT